MSTPVSDSASRGDPSSAAAADTVVPTGHDMPRGVAALVFLRDRGIFILWLLLILVFSFWCAPYFFTWSNAMLIANAAALTAIFAAGVGLGVMSGVLDLSLPGTAAFCACLTGWLAVNKGVSLWIAVPIALVCGALIGVVNGLISLQGFNPIIVTIGTLSVLTGLASVITGGLTIPGLDGLTFMGTRRYFGVPAPVYIVAALYLVGTIFLTRTRDGIRFMAVGGNAEAVRRSGIHSDRYKVMGFVISGICAAIGGLVATAITTEANPDASPAIIFSALTAVALAGVSMSGGRGSLPRVLVGALILATIANGLIIRGVQTYWATVIAGVLLLASLGLERFIQKSVSDRLMATSNLSVHQKKV